MKRDNIILDVITDGLDSRLNKILYITYKFHNSNKINFISTKDLNKKEIFNQLEKLREYGIIGHNLSFDLGFIADQYDIVLTPNFDTMLGATIINHPKVDIISLATHFGPYEFTPEEASEVQIVKDRFTTDKTFNLAKYYEEVGEEKFKKYCTTLLLLSEKVAGSIGEVMNDSQIFIMQLEMESLKWALNIKKEGLKIDVSAINKIRDEVKEKIEKKTALFESWAGRKVNLNSTKDMKKLLFEEKKLTPQVLTPSGEPSTSVEALEGLKSNEGVENLQELRHYISMQKVLEGFEENYVYQDKLHPETSVIDVFSNTSRITVKPNLHFGKETRRMLIPNEGKKFVCIKPINFERTLVENAVEGGNSKSLNYFYNVISNGTEYDIDEANDVLRAIYKGNGVDAIASFCGVDKDRAEKEILSRLNDYYHFNIFLDDIKREIIEKGCTYSFILKRKRYFGLNVDADPDKLVRQALDHIFSSDFYDTVKLGLGGYNNKGEIVYKVIHAYKSILIEVDEKMSLNEAIELAKVMLTTKVNNRIFAFDFKIGEGYNWYEASDYSMYVVNDNASEDKSLNVNS